MSTLDSIYTSVKKFGELYNKVYGREMHISGKLFLIAIPNERWDLVIEDIIKNHVDNILCGNKADQDLERPMIMMLATTFQFIKYQSPWGFVYEPKNFGDMIFSPVSFKKDGINKFMEIKISFDDPSRHY